MAVLGPADTCVAPVNTVAEAVADEQYGARGVVVDAVSSPTGRSGSPRPSGPAPSRRTAPTRSATARVTDTAELLAAVGLDAGRVDELVGTGVIA